MTIRWGKSGNCQILFSWALKSLWIVTSVMKLKDLCPWKKSYEKPWQCIKKQKHLSQKKRKIKNLLFKQLKKRKTSLYQQRSVQSKLWFSSSQVWMCKLDHKEGWALKNWCFQIVVLVKTLESPLDSKIKPVNPKGYQPWVFIGRTDAEAPILWPPVVKSWLTGKDADTGKDWRWEEKGMTEDEMVGWHHWLNG